MQENERCCGTGTCIINAQGHCWCGQQWDGVKMCMPDMASAADPKVNDTVQTEKETTLHGGR